MLKRLFVYLSCVYKQVTTEDCCLYIFYANTEVICWV